MKCISRKTRIGIVLLASLSASLTLAAGIEDSQLGLSKTPLKSTPTPTGFKYNEQFPGSSQLLQRSYPGAPAQIPHNIESFIPVSKDNNMCKGCHDRPDDIGKPKTPGLATAIPASHYTDLRFGGKQGKTLVGARTVCTQCHVPQANVKPLVENTFESGD